MKYSKEYLDKLTYEVIGCAIEVHREVGPGLLESIYEKFFRKELELRGIAYVHQVWVPVAYKGVSVGVALRLDLMVEEILCVELKAVEALGPIHDAILLSYMKMLQKPKGLLLNFNSVNIFREGQKTLVNELYRALPDN